VRQAGQQIPHRQAHPCLPAAACHERGHDKDVCKRLSPHCLMAILKPNSFSMAVTSNSMSSEIQVHRPADQAMLSGIGLSWPSLRLVA